METLIKQDRNKLVIKKTNEVLKNTKNNKMNNSRSSYIDFVKAFAVILVVIGHCIQYGSGNAFLISEQFFYNKLFVFIYSIHMPLFSVISGYLFYNTIKKYSLISLIKYKTIYFLFPLCTYSLIFMFPILVKYSGHINIIRLFLKTIIGNFWFVFAILIFQLMVSIINNKTNDNLAIYLLILILTLFIDIKILATSFYIYPFFIIGYIFNKYNLKKYYFKYKVIIIPISLIIYIFLILYYGYDSFIYTSGYSILIKNKLDVYKLLIDIYRFTIGLFGVISIMSILEIINSSIKYSRRKIIEVLSKNSMVIYMTSCITNIYLLIKITYNLKRINYLLTIIESFFTILIVLLIAKILEKFKVTGLLFLGKK